MRLQEIANTLKNSDKKVQLIYGFNGTGKTRLSSEFRQLFNPVESVEKDQENSDIKILYYNAYTEDLFYWDNDLAFGTNKKLMIRSNDFTDLVLNTLKDQGLDRKIITNFQDLTYKYLTPEFAEDYSKVYFSIKRGDDNSIPNVKISKGEESNFIWCVFYSLLEKVVEISNIIEPENRPTNKFNNLKYVFIDDPVSSLDDTNLIELAVNIAELIKSSESDLKFIITTHNPLFYNILYNELPKSEKKLLEKLADGSMSLIAQSNDSPFSYHLYLLKELNNVILNNEVKKYHFNLLRNILEKTATFLGYKRWDKLLPDDENESRKAYHKRIVNLSSHSKHSDTESSIINDNDKKVLKYLVEHLIETYKFNNKP